MKTAVFCVGNKLMLDDGIGPAVYEELVNQYEFPEEVTRLLILTISLSRLMRLMEQRQNQERFFAINPMTSPVIKVR